MHDPLQHALYTLASGHAPLRALAIVCASYLVYVMAVAWVVVAVSRRAALSVAVVARLAVMVALAFLASRLLGGVVADPRPYLVDHLRPLATVSHDNGFPSDHALLAAALTAGLWWIDRRWLPPFAVATVLVMLGRLAIGAHHTLDVTGSVAIVLVAALVAALLPLPTAWRRAIVIPAGTTSRTTHSRNAT